VRPTPKFSYGFAMRCGYCHLESEWEAAFRRTRKAFSFQELQPICPKCWENQWAVLTKRALVFVVVMSLLQILASLTIVESGNRAAMLAVGCFIYFVPLAIVLHELAHAFASLALGLRLFGVSIGLSGRILVRRRFLNCELEIRQLPTGGITRTAPRSLHWLRLRWGLMVAAAPLANALLAGIAFAAKPRSPIVEGLAMSFAWANLIALASSLFPWKHAAPIGVVPSDGLALLTLPFASKKKVEEKHIAYFAMEAMAALRKKDYHAIIAWADEGLRQYPGEVQNRCLLGIALLGLDRFAEARSLFLDLSEINEPPADSPPYKAIFFNNVASTDFFSDDPDLLEEADDYSSRAMRLTPWVPAIKESRGSVLVGLGRLDEAIELLQQSFDEHEWRDDKATSACMLAIAFNKAGNQSAGQRLLERARSLDPQCSLLPRATRELDGKSAVNSPAEFEKDREAIAG
jgi:tetratricopeptide (TPR) repeat protein